MVAKKKMVAYMVCMLRIGYISFIAIRTRCRKDRVVKIVLNICDDTQGAIN